MRFDAAVFESLFSIELNTRRAKKDDLQGQDQAPFSSVIPANTLKSNLEEKEKKFSGLLGENVKLMSG